METESIFEHEFYAPLLAAGVIPGQGKVPADLLQAMAILLGRVVDGYVDPRECAGAAALVVLGMQRESVSSFPATSGIHKQSTARGLAHNQNTFDEALKRVWATKPAHKIVKKKAKKKKK